MKEYKRISSCLVRGGICVIVKEIFNVGDFIMPQPFLSVLILTKNNQRSINYALMSVQPYADEIIVLTDKGIEERGSHKELIKKGGIYDELNRYAKVN